MTFAAAAGTAVSLDDHDAGSLDPRGKTHIAVGVADTLDPLKTFVEAEGNFSPGVGTCGISFWVFDAASGRLLAPTMDGVAVEHGLAPGGLLLPWSRWRAGDVAVRTEVCEVRRASPGGDVFVVGARVTLTNEGDAPARAALFAALRPLGPAGGDVRSLAVNDAGDTLLLDGRAALVAERKPEGAGVVATDAVGRLALAGKLPGGKTATSETGDASGALRFDVALAPGQTKTLGFVCPVLPGRRAARHRWDGVSEWAQFDLAELDGSEGHLQPEPGVDFYRALDGDDLFAQAERDARDLAGRVRLRLPDPRWTESFAAVMGHVALAMNEGAPDVSVLNYNVYSRDGVYVTNILQKSGRPDLAERAIDYFLAHPFNGRSYPEADNPGQVLWIMGEHWRFTGDLAWLARVYPAVRKLAALVRYSRTAPGPHVVGMNRLDFGNAVPEAERRELGPGACDGFHPEYTEAFDVAGLRAAARLAEAAGNDDDAAAWRELATSLFASYDARFGDRLPREYGSYCVLWPCRLYPLESGKARDAFAATGAQAPSGWRYFPLATAHQGLLSGNREAGYRTLAAHLDHEQMRGWYAFDEGGKSGAGGWPKVRRTTWDGSVAMPHGWSIAEHHLLLRDCLVFEDGDRLVLLAGIDPAWFTDPSGLSIENLPTHFGNLSLHYQPENHGATLTLSGATPAGGVALRLPAALDAEVTADGRTFDPDAHGNLVLPPGTTKANLRFRGIPAS